MNKIAIVITLVILVLGFAFSTAAAYKGVGLVASGTGGDTSSRSSVWFPIFVGGGPGGGK